MAVAAARDDPRFPPLGADELDDLEIEVSVLTPLVRAQAADVVPGRDGVMVGRGGRSGVLLPQVAAHHGWDRERLLSEVCRKAGLPRDAWREEGTELQVFQAQVITATPA
jgi:AmmeMemoRadiSam system protein A